MRLTLILALVSVLVASSPARARGCEFDSDGRRTRYDFDLTFDWLQRRLQVEQVVHFRNDFDQPLTELVFHSEPHRLTGVNIMVFHNAFDAEGTALPGVTIDAMRLTVPLIENVQPGCDAQVRLVYDIRVRPLDENNLVGWLSYTGRQFNLAHWFPVLGLYNYDQPGEWYTPRRHFIGEQTATEAADIHALFRLENAPLTVEIAAPGVVSQVEPHVWDITLDGGRDLGLSFSTEYIILTRQVRDVTVEIYALADTNVNATNRVLNDTTQALTLFEDLYGDYPWSRLAIVEGDFPDGLELSGMAFVSSDWFVGWNGAATHWLPIITVHEIAHQWFYAMVGNDQSQHPFLDEALTTYSELLYFENYHPTLTEQWWDFRIRQYDLAEGAVDATVYDYGAWRPYINAVYFRGAQMLHAIRLALGDEIFFEWLADYVNQTRGTITTPRVFWDALPPSAYEATHHVRTRYMRNSNPLAE